MATRQLSARRLNARDGQRLDLIGEILHTRCRLYEQGDIHYTFQIISKITIKGMIKYLFVAVCVAVLSGCSPAAPATPDDRQLESRIFVTRDESLLIKDGAVILENMGYKTDLVNPDIGLVTATKHEDNGGFASMMMSVLSAGLASSGKDTLSRATFTTMPARGRAGAFITRLTLQQMVFRLQRRGERHGLGFEWRGHQRQAHHGRRYIQDFLRTARSLNLH